MPAQPRPEGGGGLPAALQTITDRIAAAMAYLSGALFLVLSFYITVDVVGRYYGGFYSGVTDEISAYALAVGSTWALAYALSCDAHVRVDVVLTHLPPAAREALTVLSLALAALFAGLLAVYAWKLTLESHAIGIRSITMLQAPLAIPQGLTAIGFSMLTLQAFLMLIVLLLRSVARARDAASGSRRT